MNQQENLAVYFAEILAKAECDTRGEENTSTYKGCVV